MDDPISQYDPKITLNFLTTAPEGPYFERKGKQKQLTGVIDELVGMLNSDGGVLAFGVTDDGKIQNLADLDNKLLTRFRTAYHTDIDPAPPIRLEEVYIDHSLIFLYHVHENKENIYSRKDSHRVFRRVNDSNYGPLSPAEIENLKYDKNLRSYEDQTVVGFSSADLDTELLNNYKQALRTDLADDEVLIRRGLAHRDGNNQLCYHNSAVLLFAKDPNKYIASAYIRYVRYKGSALEPGTKFNVIKDEVIKGNIPSIIIKTRDFLRVAFSDFYSFDVQNGIFTKRPEYPEAAWLEGVVNAVFHRSYNLHGNCIYIKHFDDRLEISNSGPLPSQVNIHNIREQRFSRNPRIGRVLYEMGYVRELNEGVARIYQSMNESELSEPVYTDQDSIVTLHLYNPIYLNEQHLSTNRFKSIVAELSHCNLTERRIIDFLLRNGHGTVAELAVFCQKGERAVRNNLDMMIAKGIVVRRSEKIRDKNAQYAFNA